jgi:hypothetical protein
LNLVLIVVHSCDLRQRENIELNARKMRTTDLMHDYPFHMSVESVVFHFSTMILLLYVV